MKIFMLLALSALSLSACGVSSEWMNTQTQSMPNGYYYHKNKQPVTNPAPSRPWITKENRNKVMSDKFVQPVTMKDGVYTGEPAPVMLTDHSAVSRAETVPRNNSKPLPYNN
jgi:hypothetical protein